jgi:hypothetical protein
VRVSDSLKDPITARRLAFGILLPEDAKEMDKMEIDDIHALGFQAALQASSYMVQSVSWTKHTIDVLLSEKRAVQATLDERDAEVAELRRQLEEAKQKAEAEKVEADLRLIAACESTATESRRSAVAEYKESEEFDRDVNTYGSQFYKAGWDDLVRKAAVLHPEIDLSEVPMFSDSDGGDE